MLQQTADTCSDAPSLATENYLAELHLLALLFCLHQREMYPNYLRMPRILAAAWLPAEVPAALERWIPGADDYGPDVCTACLHIHGKTIGGRLRSCCYVCKSYSCDYGGYVVQELAIIWRISQPSVEFLLATALAKVSHRATIRKALDSYEPAP